MWTFDDYIFITIIVTVIGVVLWDMKRNGDWK
jgi:hypothetical protein